ncbi:MAG: MFS transporter [Actinobacteria bacterium]|nr:MFS transporter [Actinomycetota bacterium]
MLKDLRHLLSHKGYGPLLAARFISNLGNGLSPIALAYGVLNLPGSTGADLSLVMAARITPMILFMLFGGVIGDRFKRNRIVGGADIIGSLIASVSALSFIFGFASVPLLVLMGGLFGILNALWWPAMSGVLPEIMPRESLQKANAIISLVSNSGFIIGALIGGTLVTLFGSGWALLVDSLRFLVAGILVWFINLPPIGAKEKNSMLHDLKIGWREFTSRSWVVAVVVGFTFINLSFEATISVLGPISFNTGGHGPRDWSFNLAAITAGMLTGSLIALKIHFPRPLVLGMISIAFTSGWNLTLAMEVTLPVVLVSAFVAGIAIEIFGVAWGSSMQANIPKESYSRVVSYDALGSYALAPIGIAFAGSFAEWMGISRTLYGSALIILVASLLPLLLKSVRGLRSNLVEQPQAKEIY